MIVPPISLSAHILLQPFSQSELAQDLAHCLNHIGLAGKLIAKELRTAGLGPWLGSTGTTNIQGEEVQQLDQQANNIFLQVFQGQRLVSVVVSEEMEKPRFIKGAEGTGRYAVFIDPLDGSSNVDVNGPLGSVFSIHRLAQPGYPQAEEDLRKKGHDQVAAGYLLFGPSVNLVYSAGKGVFQFTLDQELGEFYLTMAQMTIPARGRIYSANEGNSRKWAQGAQDVLRYLQEPDTQTGRPYSGRYSGCLVADVHRILLKGGLYFYPADVKNSNGKLRLMYEAAPLSFVVEQAGGMGSTGLQRINDLVPQALHDRVPLWIGSRDDVILAESYLRPKSQT
ncbi:MAG: class 1 fructose-bisphosphatase [Nitrospirales bacterium]|nr:class 1 fructose-bisphosphatase [Nitrospirales bacterium]